MNTGCRQEAMGYRKYYFSCLWLSFNFVAELTTSWKPAVVFLIQKRGLTEQKKGEVQEKTPGNTN